MISTKCKRPDTWLPNYVSNWVLLKSRPYAAFDDAARNGYPATRIREACQGTELDWIALFAVAAVKTDYFRHATMDYFACSLGGIFSDQLINSTLEWPKFDNVEDLKLSEDEVSQVEQIHALLCGHCRRSADAAMDQPIPAPIPKPKPIPVPPVVVPPAVPATTEPAPVAEVPATKPGWKKICATVAGVIGGSLFLVKLFAPAVVVMGLELLQKLLNLIGG